MGVVGDCGFVVVVCTVCRCVRLSVCMSVCLFVCLSACLLVCLSVCLSVCQFVCLSVVSSANSLTLLAPVAVYVVVDPCVACDVVVYTWLRTDHEHIDDTVDHIHLDNRLVRHYCA